MPTSTALHDQRSPFLTLCLRNEEHSRSLFRTCSRGTRNTYCSPFLTHRGRNEEQGRGQYVSRNVRVLRNEYVLGCRPFYLRPVLNSWWSRSTATVLTSCSLAQTAPDSRGSRSCELIHNQTTSRSNHERQGATGPLPSPSDSTLCRRHAGLGGRGITAHCAHQGVRATTAQRGPQVPHKGADAQTAAGGQS